MFLKSFDSNDNRIEYAIENMHLGKLLFPVTICLKFYKKECLFRELMLASCDQEKMLCFHTCEENTSFCDFVYEERAIGFSYIFYQKSEGQYRYLCPCRTFFLFQNEMHLHRRYEIDHNTQTIPAFWLR